MMTKEIRTSAWSGAIMLPVTLMLIFGGIALFPVGASQDNGLLIFCGVFSCLVGVLSSFGYFTLQPNEARVMVLFGSYKGTVRESGFYWANPFYTRSQGSGVVRDGQSLQVTPGVSMKLSLRARNFECQKLKVNDKGGNPIEIAAVVVWRVEDSAQALFDVDRYQSYVEVQSETAVRHIASSFPYDNGEPNEITLRGGTVEISNLLCAELQDRLAKAGVIVEDARLTHLAYAPEIAQVMLRRQQAEAVIAAREKLVTGAVGMVEMALRQLSEREVVVLDDERKAAMVSNLLVVLCGESEVQPVINAGTLYH